MDRDGEPKHYRFCHDQTPCDRSRERGLAETPWDAHLPEIQWSRGRPYSRDRSRDYLGRERSISGDHGSDDCSRGDSLSREQPCDRPRDQSTSTGCPIQCYKFLGHGQISRMTEKSDLVASSQTPVEACRERQPFQRNRVRWLSEGADVSDSNPEPI